MPLELAQTINLADFSGLSELEVLNLGSYNRLYIVVVNALGTDATLGELRIQYGNSVGYDTTGVYNSAFYNGDLGGGSNTSTGSTYVRLSIAGTNSVSTYAQGEIIGFNSVTPTWVVTTTQNSNNTGSYWFMGVGYNVKAYDRIKILRAAGTFASGTIQIWGDTLPFTLVASGALSGSSFAVTGLDAYDKVYAMVANASSTGSIHHNEIGTSGGYLTAGNYLSHARTEGGGVSSVDKLLGYNGATFNTYHLSDLGGFKSPLIGVSYMGYLAAGSAPGVARGYTLPAQVYDRLRIIPDSGTFSGGNAYILAA